MRTLAIDCATEACSVALFDGDELLESHFRVLGRGHAEHLVPTIAALPDRGRADRIRVSLGPGSFTGVRIGISAARALGLAWQAQVTGYPTLALVAAAAVARETAPVTVCMKGGHGEWFVQDFDERGHPTTDLASLVPAAAASRGAHRLIAGNASEALAEATGGHPHTAVTLPDAACALLVPEALHSRDLAPIYGRAPDARRPA